MSPRLFLGAMTSSFNVFVRVLVAMDGRCINRTAVQRNSLLNIQQGLFGSMC